MFNSLVIEANIIFASLIKQLDNFKLVFLLPEIGITLYSPQFVYEEINKREEKLLKYSKLSSSEFRFLINKLFKNVRVVPEIEYKSFLSEAKSIFSSHPKDAPYFALSLKLKTPLWSNEKLHKRQSKVKVMSTDETIKLLQFPL